MIVRVTAVLDTPTVPFAICVVGPIPSVLFKQVNAIGQVLARAGCPADRTKFAHIDMHIIGLLNWLGMERRRGILGDCLRRSDRYNREESSE